MDEIAHSYADWLDMKRLEMVLQKSKNPGAAKEKAIQEGRVIPEHFVKAFERTPIEKIKENFEKLDILEKNIDLLNIKLDENEEKLNAVFISIDAEYAGYIVINDVIKTEAKEVINELKTLGIYKSYMLTGDKKEVAFDVGNKLGIDEIKYELLPHEKLSNFEQIW